jgi:hypothetical protein
LQPAALAEIADMTQPAKVSSSVKPIVAMRLTGAKLTLIWAEYLYGADGAVAEGGMKAVRSRYSGPSWSLASASLEWTA